MQDKIDKIKENLGIGELDKETRKELFEKFVDAGGQVIDEKDRRRTMIIDREKQKDYQQKLDGHRLSRTKQYDRENGKTPVKAGRSPGKTGYREFIDYIKIRLALRFKKISGISGKYFKKKFFQKFNNTYRPALIEINTFFLEVFKKNIAKGNRITERLDKISPLYYELLEMAGDLYDGLTCDEISEYYINPPEKPVTLNEIKDALMSIYRQITLIKPFETSLTAAFDAAFEIEKKVDTDRTDFFSSDRKRTHRAISTLFNRLYPSLHALFCAYQNKIYETFDPQIEKILGIDENEKPGRRARKTDTYIQEQPADAETPEKKTGKTEERQLPEEVKKGLEIMYSLNFQELRKSCDSEGIFEHLSQNDRILIIYLLFTEFDKMYSPALTTAKIKFQVEHTDGGKVDYRARLQYMYDSMRLCMDAIKNYKESYTVYENIRTEKRPSGAGYIEHTKRFEAAGNKKTKSEYELRTAVRTFMLKLSETLKPLIQDMDGAQKYVLNPQEVLEFNTSIEGENKINRLKVYRALQTVYYYSCAMAHRLGPEGDLYHIEEDYKPRELPADSEPRVQNAESLTDEDPGIPGEDSGEKSLLDEIGEELKDFD